MLPSSKSLLVPSTAFDSLWRTVNRDFCEAHSALFAELSLIRNTVPLDVERLYGSIRRVSLSFAVNEGELGEEFESFGEVDSERWCFHDRGLSLERVQANSNVRHDALVECLVIVGVEKLSVEEVQKIKWKALDEKMKKWIQAVKITVRLLNFGEAVAIGKRLSEKLFRILDMYDAGCGERDIFEFESALKNEASKKPMQNGEIHPLTHYVMNYVKLLVDYSETLNSLLESDEDEAEGLQSEDGELETVTPFAKRLLLLISSLESNLEEKSKLYEDGALHYIFLMNNNMYIVQKVKDSELRKLLGDNWVRKRCGSICQYATSYLRACWTKALYCLKYEGIGGSSKNASKVVALKEIFKSFNACFEDIYRIQTGWKVPDPQLREELRISISEKVIPAYRSFMRRFGSQLDSGRHAGKYINYKPDDLENYLLDLFEGTPLVLHHMRRNST
ncbi:Detected protein of confused Function [Hibiscus syriacus]|uniref:Exocyst subunit Exo70 family protein n=1 Tax=Hibiscus syriacus TaxID=106335 RepID=A0A6A3CPU9_HIBSY|nr:Detected protein of confused Function [Hibiscus syriacus]